MRLFQTPRSTWDDYSRKAISTGGGVYRRAAKRITISPELKKLLKIEKDSLVPNELIQCILRAPVDLLWNGGIGTFVKASTETHAEVGDRSNDNIRINGNELCASVVVEGGNLGLTQLGRIEFELSGGRINTDFIDNSAGVDCSDHEVNIKILLNMVVSSGDLTEKQRNVFLAKMTDEVAHLVLQNNYHQNQAISMISELSPEHMGLYIKFLEVREKEGKINRALEFLPDHKALLERKSAGKGLTRPEVSVLFAYSKIILEEAIRRSDLPFDPYLSQYVKGAFPTPLLKRYAPILKKHRLFREIVSTQLSNHIVSHMGITFTYQMRDETGGSIDSVVKAYIAAETIFHMEDVIADIESLDYKIDVKLQIQMVDEVVRLVRRATRWFLRNRREAVDIAETIAEFSDKVSGLYRRLPKILLGTDKENFNKHRAKLVDAGVPEELASKLASNEPMYHALNIIEAALANDIDVNHVARIYFGLVDRLELLWFREQINAYPVENSWSVLAKAAYKGDLDWIQRELAMRVLNLQSKAKSINGKLNAWFEKHEALIDRWESILSDLRSAEAKDFAILVVATRELNDIAQTGV